MIVKTVNDSDISNDDIELYKSLTSKLEGVIFNGPTVGIDKRLVSIRLGDVSSELVLVNPRIIQSSEDYVVYFEKDYNNLKKVRKTKRKVSILVETDNLGKVEFTPSSEKKAWETVNDFMTDQGLLECVLAQRVIDSINGIDISHPNIKYTQEVQRPKKIGRNEKVMLQSPDGEHTMFVKYKKSDEYIQQGYKII
jgi:hypothetical protein